MFAIRGRDLFSIFLIDSGLILPVLRLLMTTDSVSIFKKLTITLFLRKVFRGLSGESVG